MALPVWHYRCGIGSCAAVSHGNLVMATPRLELEFPQQSGHCAAFSPRRVMEVPEVVNDLANGTLFRSSSGRLLLRLFCGPGLGIFRSGVCVLTFRIPTCRSPTYRIPTFRILASIRPARNSAQSPATTISLHQPNSPFRFAPLGFAPPRFTPPRFVPTKFVPPETSSGNAPSKEYPLIRDSSSGTPHQGDSSEISSTSSFLSASMTNFFIDAR